MSNLNYQKFIVHFKKWRSTIIMITLTVFVCIYSTPIKPWIPAKNELQYVSGYCAFNASTSRHGGTRTSFNVNKIFLNCFFSPLFGDGHGCEDFEGRIELKSPVKASYFPVNIRLGRDILMLNTLEQNGKIIVSEIDTYNRRVISYKADIKSQYVNTIAFVILTILTPFIEMQKQKRRKNV